MNGKCRISGEELTPVIDLGSHYISDFVSKDNITNKDTYKLLLGYGTKSKILQLWDSYPPEKMFIDYYYKSDMNEVMINEMKDIARTSFKYIGVNQIKHNDVILDIGSNVGTLLNEYRNILGPKRYVGIDPSNVAKESKFYNTDGLLINDFFSIKNYFAHEEKQAKIITSIAMFYDIENPIDWLKEVYECLSHDGLFILQINYTPFTILSNCYDNLGNEHIMYYSFSNLLELFNKAGFKIVDLEFNNINGGCIRIYANKEIYKNPYLGEHDKIIAQFKQQSTINFEDQEGFNSIELYKNWQKEIEDLKKDTIDWLTKQKECGKKVVGLAACYDESTRVVTVDGIKKWQELTRADKVITINPDNKQIEINNIEDIISYKYDGELIHFNGRCTDILVTPDHKMFIELFRRNRTIGGKLKFESAGKTMNRSVIRLPKGIWKGKDENQIYINKFIDQNLFSKRPFKIPEILDTKDFFYIMGLYIGDGYIDTHSGGFSVNFCIPEKDKARQRLESTLDRMDIKYKRHALEVHVSSKALAHIFISCGKGALNKQVPSWVLEYSREYLECLLDGLVDSDGWYSNCKRRRNFCTSSFKLSKDVIEICIKLGLYPSIMSRKSIASIKNRIISGNINYVININTKQRCIYKENNKKINYSGNVWCLSVKNKNFLIERNGKIAFCGNSTRGNTILQYCGITPDLISCIGERDPSKVGKYTIGTGIPIVSEDEMRAMNPDYLFVFTYHYRNSIVEREKDLLAKGTKLVFPIPQLSIL